MPEINIIAGSRTYPVECEPQELEDATAAASILNGELASITSHSAEDLEMAPSRMFMLAGLRIAGRLAEASGQPDTGQDASEDDQSLSAADEELLERLAQVAGLAEDLADRIEAMFSAENRS